MKKKCDLDSNMGNVATSPVFQAWESCRALEVAILYLDALTVANISYHKKPYLKATR